MSNSIDDDSMTYRQWVAANYGEAKVAEYDRANQQFEADCIANLLAAYRLTDAGRALLEGK